MSNLYIISNWGADYPKSWEFAKHWVKHYRDMVADKIIILLHTSEKNSESYLKMHKFLLALGVDEIIEWVGGYSETVRTKKINKFILPRIFKDNRNLWVMVPDDDELFQITENISDTKKFLCDSNDKFKERKLLITSHRIYMRSSNGDVVEKVLPNVPIYEQFPIAVKQEQFSYINHSGKEVENDINKVVAFNYEFRLRRGWHGIREINWWNGRIGSRFKRENTQIVDGLKICCHNNDIIEIISDGAAFEYKDFKIEKNWYCDNEIRRTDCG
jgi:hypothetical protein